MKKNHRVATMISDKHWELLKKHAETFETQKKTLELALECLEKSSRRCSESTIEKNTGCVMNQ